MTELKNRKLALQVELNRLLEKLESCESALKFLPATARSPNNDLYFDDGVRRIDFVLVYNDKNNDYVKSKVNRYIRNLEDEGLEFEGYKSKINPQHIFIKVHGKTDMLIKRASIFDITLAYENENKVMHTIKWKIMDIMHTELTRPNVNSRTYQRASDSISGSKPKHITSAERIMLVYELLKYTKYGPRSHEFGVNSLLKEHSLFAAYPLHDGTHSWTVNGPLNDRQLLSRFWAKGRYFYKYQPLDLIHQYYGPEVAFYFAFCGFYNKMLAFASLMGLISTAYGILTFSNPNWNYVSKSICKSNANLCPYCYYPEICHFQEMKSYCTFSKLSYIIDNTGTFCYAILMCFWATIFMELWKRKQKTLMYKWNILNVEDDPSLRNDFIIRANHWRKSKYEDRLVPYETSWRKFLKYMTSYIVIQFFIVVMISVIYGTILVRLIIRYWLIKFSDNATVRVKEVSLVSTGIVNSIIIAFMITCELFYEYLARFLTNFENPRTQMEYDKLFIFKQYTLFFLNAYGPLYYTSFFKGILFTYPGDSSQFEGLGIANADLCGPTGCILQISIQLVMTITGKILVKFSLSHVKLYIIRYFQRKRRHANKHTFSNFPFFESSLIDHRADYYFLLKDYREMMIQYGYIVLFAAAFPLTPLLALISNVIDLRIDAYKFTKFYRRPVPVRTSGIGAWNSVLKTLTCIGVITNAFLIAFSTHFVPDMIKKISVDYYNDDFVEFAFSSFAVNDYDSKFPDILKQNVKGTECLYLGKRYPPQHKNKYQFTSDHWHELSIRFISVLVLEVLVICFTALLAFIISDIPRPIKEYLIAKQKAEQENKRNEIIKAFRESNEI